MYRFTVLAAFVLVGMVAAYQFSSAEEPAAPAETPGVVAIQLGATIERTMDQVKADNYAYGPKQDVDATTGETHVYLPYGVKSSLYFGQVLGYCTDPTADHVAEYFTRSSNERGVLTYKMTFDKPISEFRFFVGYAEVALAEKCVAGAEYSVDGKEWKTLKEYAKGTPYNVNPFVPSDTKAAGLNTKELLVRIYTRNSADPTAASGPEEYLKLHMAGLPGDTFFAEQLQIWVTEAK